MVYPHLRDGHLAMLGRERHNERLPSVYRIDVTPVAVGLLFVVLVLFQDDFLRGPQGCKVGDGRKILGFDEGGQMRQVFVANKVNGRDSFSGEKT